MSTTNFSDVRKAISDFSSERNIANKGVRVQIILQKLTEVRDQLLHFRSDLEKASNRFSRAYNDYARSHTLPDAIKVQFLGAQVLIDSVSRRATDLFEGIPTIEKRNPITSACSLASSNIERNFIGKRRQQTVEPPEFAVYRREKEELSEAYDRTQDPDEHDRISARIEMLGKLIGEKHFEKPELAPEGLKFVIESVPRCVTVIDEIIAVINSALSNITIESDRSALLKWLQPIYDQLRLGRLYIESY